MDMAISNPAEPDLVGCRNSNPARAGAGAGFGNLFWDHRTIRPMELMASTMLPAIGRPYR